MDVSSRTLSRGSKEGRENREGEAAIIQMAGQCL